MTTTTKTPVDQVLCAAMHEAGHAVAFQAAGAKVLSIQVYAHGNTAAGDCYVDDDQIPDLPKYLTAIMAGTEAQARWLARYHGHTLGSARREIGSGSAHDKRDFARYARGSGISEARARRKAQSFVSSHWGRIERLGKKLAKRGRLSSWSL